MRSKPVLLLVSVLSKPVIFQNGCIFPFYSGHSFPAGRADGRPPRYGQNPAGESRSDRMPDHLLQRLLLNAHLQIQRGVGETRAPALRNGESTHRQTLKTDHPLVDFVLTFCQSLYIKQVARRIGYVYKQLEID